MAPSAPTPTPRIPEGLPGAGNIPVFNNGDELEGLYRDYSSAVGSVSF